MSAASMIRHTLIAYLGLYLMYLWKVDLVMQKDMLVSRTTNITGRANPISCAVGLR